MATQAAPQKIKTAKNVAIIGVSGAPGSFSEEAGRTYAVGAGLTNVKIEYHITVENVLAALEDGRISLAVFPIQNSTMGLVAEAAYAMAKHRFTIKKIFDIVIHQNLLVQKGVKAEQIITIVSQEPALKQCTMYFKRVWPEAMLCNYEDTAKAAADLANGTLPKTTGVIASAAAAKLYGLDILDESVQDLKTNATTFIAAVK